MLFSILIKRCLRYYSSYFLLFPAGLDFLILEALVERHYSKKCMGSLDNGFFFSGFERTSWEKSPANLGLFLGVWSVKKVPGLESL